MVGSALRDTATAPAPAWRRAADGEGRFTPSVVVVPAGGEVWEDFLDSIGLSLEDFCREGPGGWLLGQILALRTLGLRTVVIYFSGRVDAPQRFVDDVTGAAVTILPAPAAYMAQRPRWPTYRDCLVGPPAATLIEKARRGVGALLWHASTPVRALAAELRRENCAAIVAQEYEYFRFEALTWLGRRLGLPVFANFQGSTEEINPLSRWLKPWSIRASAGLLIAASDEAERVRRRYGARARLFQVFNPVQTELWTGADRAQARAAIGAAADTRVVVWHGRISIYTKGLDVLLQAWGEVRRARPGQDLRLRLLGAGEDGAAFARRLADLADPTVAWRNAYLTSRAEIRDFLAAGDVFAFPSRREGFAVAPLEAMACGLPVVAAEASGVTDIFPDGAADGGLTTPRDDPAAFAKALGRVLDDPEFARELGARAARRVESAFSPAAVGRQLATALGSAGVSGGQG